jgi:hypothetical protein
VIEKLLSRPHHLLSPDNLSNRVGRKEFMNKTKNFPKHLKVCSEKQAFRLWLEYKGTNGRIASDLFDMFGGSSSKLYMDFCRSEKVSTSKDLQSLKEMDNGIRKSQSKRMAMANLNYLVDKYIKHNNYKFPEDN